MNYRFHKNKFSKSDRILKGCISTRFDYAFVDYNKNGYYGLITSHMNHVRCHLLIENDENKDIYRVGKVTFSYKLIKCSSFYQQIYFSIKPYTYYEGEIRCFEKEVGRYYYVPYRHIETEDWITEIIEFDYSGDPLIMWCNFEIGINEDYVVHEPGITTLLFKDIIVEVRRKKSDFSKN